MTGHQPHPGTGHTMMGQVVEVLCEGYDDETELYYGRSYADSVEVDGKVFFASETEVQPGTFVTVRIENSLGADLEGVRVGG